MGFVIRLHDPSEQQPRLIGRVPTALDALALVRQWRDENPDAWVEFVRPGSMTPSGNAA
jgi:hypothetical protein